MVAALVDVPDGVFRQSVDFWSGVVGVAPETGAQDPDYAEFGELFPGFHFMVQRVDAPARVHLDVETDDVAAEVRRLERLGAQRVQQVRTWQVMRDPAGLLFCVVRVQSPSSFAEHAVTWDDDGNRVD